MNIITVHFAPDRFLKAVNSQFAARGLLHETISGGEVRKWHAIAWTSRFMPPPENEWNPSRPASQLGPDSIAQILQTVDRVFVSPQPVRQILSYLDWLYTISSERISTFPPESVVLYARTPHYPWEVVFAKRAESMGHHVLTLRRNIVIQNRVTLEKGADFAHPKIAAAPADWDSPSIRDEDLSLSFPSVSTLNDDTPLRSRISWWFQLLIWAMIPPKIGPVLTRVALDRKNQCIFSRSELLIVLMRLVREAARCRRFLRRHGRSSAELSDYVLVALHYQPESTTDPDAGRLTDQVLFVKRLRDVMNSAGFQSTAILVREHPRQVARHIPALGDIHFRSLEFYESMLNVDNVYFAQDVDSMQSLIERSRLVATVAGTAAWQALLAGRPSVTGRRTWFSGCRASPALAEIAANDARFAELMGMDAVGVETAFRQFLKRERYTFPGANSAADLHIGTEDWESFADSMVEQILVRIATT